ncbi:MAG: hypothetical protein AVDCRST_MAG49-2771 [uncultured Thermomicrobiales bacterium]|uniref:Uncharacterized protein n=1 Tax=uncultured Thermomicrobiales bacterium TaxID=1645740 RepID=A0A6J4UYK3_9BACT|nr:MAG: hypothetical protein AVDCRST_MAG49-2771 [uncultured Thermomicrobiales bacterium]
MEPELKGAYGIRVITRTLAGRSAAGIGRPVRSRLRPAAFLSPGLAPGGPSQRPPPIPPPDNRIPNQG